jgi:hypothetical protein
MLQEEYIPGHESIYYRSIAPGPGYYTVNSACFEDRHNVNLEKVSSFGSGHRIDHTMGLHYLKDIPGPGEHATPKGLAESKGNLGRFGRSVKCVTNLESVKKLPFISHQASKVEAYGIHSPSKFHDVPEDSPHLTRGHVQAPKYSFGQARRPF